jgi:hypothetical protein
MNAYTTMSQARIRQHDIDRVLRADRMTAAAHLAALERQRGWLAEAEVNQLVKQHGVKPQTAVSLIATVRQTLGAALVRAGQRLAAPPARGASAATGLSTGTLRTTG